MAKKFPIHPTHPERICWGCDKYCSTESMKCGNGSDRTQHPVELFGDNWLEFDNQSSGPHGVATESSIEQSAKTLK